MFARIPALLLQGKSRAAVRRDVWRHPRNLGGAVLSSRHIPAQRRGTAEAHQAAWRPDLTLPLSDGVLKSLREAVQATGKDSMARLASDLLEKIASDVTSLH